MKTTEEFNEKYKDNLAEGFEGLSFGNEKVIEYLDKEFSKAVKEDGNFYYEQIKVKWGTPRVYTSSQKDEEWEEAIRKILEG